MLEITYNSVNDEGVYDPERSMIAVENLQTMLLNAAQGQVRRLNDNLLAFIRRIRQADEFALPVLLKLAGSRQMSLLQNIASFQDISKREQLVRLGLRCGLFSTPDGISWHPYLTLDSVELQPLYIWRRNDTWR